MLDFAARFADCKIRGDLALVSRGYDFRQSKPLFWLGWSPPPFSDRTVRDRWFIDL